MCKNTVEADRVQMKIRRMRIRYWIGKATDTHTHTHTHTHSQFVIIVAFPLQQWLRERSFWLRYTYIAFVVYFQNVTLFSGTDLSGIYLIF
jgi:hypothetical protein